MALFPAYSLKLDSKYVADDSLSGNSDEWPAECSESQLLASDGDDERSRECPERRDERQDERRDEPACKARRLSALDECADFYLDRKLDRGNLRVSTLYYPGRPEYACAASARAVREPRARYYSSRAPDAPAAPALAERQAAFRRLLARAPLDAALWDSYVDFQEACGGADAALAAAEEGSARLPAAARLRARLLAALRRALPPHAALDRLRDMLAKERAPAVRAELWEALLLALAAAPSGDAAQLDAAAAAALTDTRALPAAYPRLLHAHGSLLRAAGLSERLALLLELVVAMNFAPDAAAPFPPPAPPDERERAERRLREAEDAALRSGLPLGAVWVRVERLRGAEHWHAPPALAARDADPQRAPLPHDVAELLRPAGAPAELLRLAVRLLLLAQVPLLPGTTWAARWTGAAGAAAHGAEALLPLLDAAAELPAPHRAHVAPAAARRVLQLLQDPPHYFSNDAGYLRWVEALWDALCARMRGAALLALVCWRVRWLGALAPLGSRAEAARLRGCARELLRRVDHPLPFAEFARLERRATGPERAAAVAATALRAAVQRADVPHHHCLYVARVAVELSGGASGAAGCCALVSAVLRRAPPAGLPAPAAADLAAALQLCEQRCDELEAALSAGEGAGEPAGEEDAARLLLPGDGEWARARALLAPPLRRAQLLRRLQAQASSVAGGGGDAARYWEESGVALAAAAAREGRAGAAARDLLPLFPDNAYLALGESLGYREKCGVALAAAAVREGRAGAAARDLLPLFPDNAYLALGESLGYREESGVALAAAAVREGRAGAAARDLLPLFPDNAYLALGESLGYREKCGVALAAAAVREGRAGAAARDLLPLFPDNAYLALGESLGYREESGVALAAAAVREGRAGAAARDLLPLFPDNAYLALESAGAPLWAWSGAGGAAQRLRALAPRGDVAALAALLPLLARALLNDFAPPEAERLVRLARRAAGGGGGGALLWALRLEAEARAPRPRLQAALYAALDAAPFAKWLYVRGAAWCGGDAPALADALLERQLRLRALPDELRALPDGAAPCQ